MSFIESAPYKYKVYIKVQFLSLYSQLFQLFSCGLYILCIELLWHFYKKSHLGKFL